MVGSADARRAGKTFAAEKEVDRSIDGFPAKARRGRSTNE
jgi:hypothetical protein